MNSATKNAAAILIFAFILCFFLIYAILFGYHNRSLLKARYADPVEELTPVPAASTQTDSTEETGLFQSLNNLFGTGSGEGAFIQESQRRKEARIIKRNERIQRRSDSYRSAWISMEKSMKIIGRSRLASRLAFIHTFKLLPALVIFLFVISFSVFFTLTPFQKDAFQYHAIAVPSYFVLIMCILLIIFSEFLFMPRLFKKTESLLHESRVAHAALAQAERLYDAEDFDRALEVVELYLEIDNRNVEARNLHTAILEKIFQTEPSREGEEAAVTGDGVALTSYKRGQRAENEGEYFLALYYYDRARAVEGERRDIREAYERVAQQANSLLATLSKRERVIQDYIETKEKALAAEENEDYYGAYTYLSRLYRYETLKKNHPELYEDVELYYRDIQNKLSQSDFLTEEITPYEWLPSYDNIVFLENREAPAPGMNPILNSVERIILWKGQYYFKNIDRLIDGRWSSFSYGKWVGNRIRVKNSSDYERVPPDHAELYYLKSGLHPQYLIFMNDQKRLSRQLDVYERFSLDTTLINNGFAIETWPYYLASKLGVFFSVYVLALVLAGIAWRRRSIYNFPPGFKFLMFLIIMPVLSYLFHRLYVDLNSMFMYTHRYVELYIVRRGFNIALYTGVLNLVIAVVATIFFLSQRSSVE
jgi:hypothetical protein